MANHPSIVSSERLFALSEEFENGFTRRQAEDALTRHGIETSKDAVHKMRLSGYIELTKKWDGAKQCEYRITDAGYRIAVEFEKMVARNAERCGYVLP